MLPVSISFLRRVTEEGYTSMIIKFIYNNSQEAESKSRLNYKSYLELYLFLLNRDDAMFYYSNLIFLSIKYLNKSSKTLLAPIIPQELIQVSLETL